MSAIKLTKDNFENEVLKAKGLVLVDFWAAWCQPCQMLLPVIDQIAEEIKGKAKVGKVNIDENQDLASQYNIMSLPTVILFKDGQPTRQWTGVQDKSVYIKAVS